MLYLRIPLLGLAFALAFALGLAGPVAASERPNLIFLLTDDQSTYSLGCYGNSDVQTPHLDRLAEDGVIFDRHYATTAICMASRANCFTGLLEYRNGTNFDHGDMTRGIWETSYPILLREAGYRTAFAGKFGLLVSDSEDASKKGYLPEKDFDAWGGGPGQTHYETAKNNSMKAYAKEFPHSTRSYGAFGRNFIEESAAGAKAATPFCLSISFKAPHMPDTPDPIFDDVYAGRTFTRPENYGREKGAHFSRQSQQGRQFERFHSWHYSDKYDEVMRRYHQQIYGIDFAVGMIREGLEKAGVADNTVIIFTSDNGFFCGSHGYGSKVLPYEESARVPLIIFDPRHENSGKQIRCQSLTGNIDFSPTLLEYAGLPAPEGIDGKSLVALYDDPTVQVHESLPLINVWGTKECRALAVVTQDMKYVYWSYDKQDFEATEELYHLGKDPLELVNVARNPEYAPQLEQMREKHDAWIGHWKEHAVPFNKYEPWAEELSR